MCLRNLAKSRRGSVALIAALGISALMLVAGVAIDLGTAYMVKQRLSQAIDSAGLAVGSSQGTQAQLETRLDNFFKANYPATVIGAPFMPGLLIQGNVITVNATATINTVFLKIVGYNTLTVTASNQITRQTRGLEVALVLDNTGSMASNGKIAALRTAATDLVNILFAGGDHPDKLRVSLVPFVTTVNIGTANSAWVDGLASANYSPSTWKGCVTERAYPYDVTDASIATGGKWKPYLWPRESQSSSCDRYSTTIDEVPSDTSGPNKSCPQPIQPLTNDKTTLLSAISAMMPWNNSGTMVHVGLGWGWRTISPNGPFTGPLPYNTDGWDKALIILTDGMNELVQQSSTCRNAGGTWTDYSGFGYPVESDSLGTQKVSGKSAKYTAAMAALDSRTAEICTNIKAKGITVYTITLQQNDSGITTLFKNCASSPDKFFVSPSSNDLQAVFHAIANNLSNLRLSK